MRGSVKVWARTRPDIVGVVLVGSWARDEARPDSDIDVLVLTKSSTYVDEVDWLNDALPGGAALVRTARWGSLVERRVLRPDGLEVEFGFVDPSWAEADPIDEGTARVIGDGHRIWYDPSGLLAELAAAVTVGGG